MVFKSPLILLVLVCGASFGQIVSESKSLQQQDVSETKKIEKTKGELAIDLQPAASAYNGPSIFASSFALRPIPALLPSPRNEYGPIRSNQLAPRTNYGRPSGGPRNRYGSSYVPVYNQESQNTFQKRGGSVGYGGVYPINSSGRGGFGERGHGGSGPGYDGYGYNHNKPPRGYSEKNNGEGSENAIDGGDYDGEYDEYDEKDESEGPVGGRNTGGQGANYDYGDPVQNGGYHFSGQTQEGDDQGRDTEGDDHYNVESGNSYGSSSGGNYGSEGGDHGEGSEGGEGGEGGYGSHSGGSQNTESGSEGFGGFDDFF